MEGNETIDGLPILKKTPPSTDEGLPIFKKKVSTEGGVNTTMPSNIGGLQDLNSLSSGQPQPQIKYAPVVDTGLKQQLEANDQNVRLQKLQQQQDISNKLNKIRNELPESAQKNWDNAINLSQAKPPDDLHAPTKEEIDHYNFMQTPVGKTLGAVAYLGSKATKGSFQIAKGLAHLTDKAFNVAQGSSAINDLTFDKLDKKANYGLTNNDVSGIEQGTGMGNKALSGLGMMAEFAPAIAGGEATNAPKALFYLQGVGQGVETMDNLEKSGVKVNPLVKEGFVQGMGVINGVLLGKIGDNLYGKLPAAVRRNIASGLVTDAIKESAGKELTADGFKELLNKGAKTFAEKFEKGGINVLSKYNKTATDLTGLNVANFALKKGVDVANDKPVFNETLGNLAGGINKTLTQDAPMFTALGAIPDATKLTPYSGYKNDVVESLVSDPSQSNVDAIKQQLAEHGSSQGWSQNEMVGTQQHVQQIADAAKKIPSTIKESKKGDAVQLIIDRDALTKRLSEVRGEKQQLDPAFHDEALPQEQFLIDKINQANDKLRQMATGKVTTYSKDDESGKFYKTTDGKRAEITPDEYKLNHLERTVNSNTNEQATESTPIENNIPKEPQTNETGAPEAVSQEPTETTQNNINQENNGKRNEMGEQPSGQESGQSGNVGNEESSSKESKAGKEEVTRNRVKDSDAPTLPELSYNLKEKGDSGIAIEPQFKRQYGTNKLTDEPLDNGTQTIVSRDKEGNVNGVLEISYNGKDGQQENPVAVKVVVDENSRRQGIATALFKHAQDNGIDLSEVRGKETTEAGQALYESNKKSNEQSTNTRTTESVTDQVQQSEAKEEKSKEPIGITKAETKKQREQRGLEDIPESEHKTLKGMFEEGKKAIEDGDVDPRKVAADVSDTKRNLSSIEVNALLADRRALHDESEGLYDAIAKADVDKDPLTAETLRNRLKYVQEQLDNNEQALRSGARENSLALNSMKSMINADYSHTSQVTRMRAAAGGELTEAMKAELDRYSAELKEAKEEVEKYKKAESERLANDTIKRTRKTTSTNKSETKEALKAERKEIVDDFLKELETIRKSGHLSSDIPYRRELVAASKFMIKMIPNALKEVGERLNDVIDFIHENFKDHIPGLTKEDVRDVLAGQYRDKKETKNELLEQKNSLIRAARLTKKIEDLKNGVESERSERKLVSKRKEIAKLEEELKSLQKQARIDNVEERTQESMQRRIDKLNQRIKDNDFDTESRPKVETPSAKTIHLQAQVRRAENNFDAMAQRLGNHTQSRLQKNLNLYRKINLAFILSGTKVLGKLYGFGAAKRVTNLFDEVANTVNSKTPFLKNIINRSPRYAGGLQAKAEAKAIAARWNMATLKDTWEIAKTGIGDLDRLYGKSGVDKDFEFNHSILDLFQHLHGALKNPTKRAEYFRSLEHRLNFLAKQGEDINDPDIQHMAGLGAYIDSKRAILMNDNMITDKFYKAGLRALEQSKEDSPKALASFIRGVFPITKVPTNFVMNAYDRVTGAVPGLSRATPLFWKAIAKGAESLSDKEADSVARILAKGQVGLAMMALAYFSPNIIKTGGYYTGKRKDNDLKAGDVIIGDFHVPHNLAHNDVIEAMQFATTVRRAQEYADRNGKGDGTLLGIGQSVKGLSTQIPFLDVKYLEDLTSDKKLTKSAGTFLKNKIEPRLIQEISEYSDKDTDKKFLQHPIDYMLSETKKRDPQSVGETLKTGIPGLRQQVAEKQEKQSKSLTNISLENGTEFKLTPEQIKERQSLNDDYIKQNKQRLTDRAISESKKDRDLNDKMKKLIKGWREENIPLDKQKEYKKDFIDDYVEKKLQSYANKHSKPIILKRYKTDNGFALNKDDE